MRALALVALISLPALAETPLSAKAFAAHVGSDTITYSYSTGLVGTADYGPERSLRWAFAGEPCFDGRWFDIGTPQRLASLDQMLRASPARDPLPGDPSLREPPQDRLRS